MNLSVDWIWIVFSWLNHICLFLCMSGISIVYQTLWMMCQRDSGFYYHPLKSWVFFSRQLSSQKIAMTLWRLGFKFYFDIYFVFPCSLSANPLFLEHSVYSRGEALLGFKWKTDVYQVFPGVGSKWISSQLNGFAALSFPGVLES